jgi:hypothetical protein
MRAWFLALAACTSKPVVQGAALDVGICEGPIDTPTCPYNPVDLGLTAAPGSTVQMLLQYDSMHQLEAKSIVIMAGSSGLYAVNPRFDDCPVHPMPDVAMWPTFDLAAGDSLQLDNVFVIGLPVCFAADAVNVHHL